MKVECILSVLNAKPNGSHIWKSPNSILINSWHASLTYALTCPTAGERRRPAAAGGSQGKDHHQEQEEARRKADW